MNKFPFSPFIITCLFSLCLEDGMAQTGFLGLLGEASFIPSSSGNTLSVFFIILWGGGDTQKIFQEFVLWDTKKSHDLS